MFEDEFGGDDRAVVAVVIYECGFHFAPARGVIGEESGYGIGEVFGLFCEISGTELLEES